MNQITFGTSGWRGILCDDFILANTRIVTRAIADYLVATGEAGKGIVVGYDTRFMGKRFAADSASVLAAAGIPVFLCSRDTPTPVISAEIIRRGAAGAINFTASHNPPEYNGIKFSPASGGPALPETTREIERRANAVAPGAGVPILPLEQAREKGLLHDTDPRESYLEDLATKVDLEAVSRLGRVALNPLYGTSRGYLDAPLRQRGMEVAVVNDHLDPYFGGNPPEPSEKYMREFIALVRDGKFPLGLAADGDADRFGIVDEGGVFIEPNYILALLLDYLVRVKKIDGGVARSVATSHLVDAVARKHGIPVYETPVGFKYIGELIVEDKIVIGGEESAGLTIRGHVPEKDGILACLLVAEMVAREGMGVQALLERLYTQVGRFVTRRDNIRLSAHLEDSFPAKLRTGRTEIAGRKVVNVVTTDGTKYLLEDGSWTLFRKSGTEPVVRVYGEAADPASLTAIMDDARAFILS